MTNKHKKNAKPMRIRTVKRIDSELCAKFTAHFLSRGEYASYKETGAKFGLHPGVIGRHLNRQGIYTYKVNTTVVPSEPRPYVTKAGPVEPAHPVEELPPLAAFDAAIDDLADLENRYAEEKRKIVARIFTAKARILDAAKAFTGVAKLFTGA